MYFKPPTGNNPQNPFYHPLNKQFHENVSVEVEFKNDADGRKSGGKRTKKNTYMMTFKNNAEMNKFMDTNADKLNEGTVDTSHYRSDHGKRPNPNETGGWSFSDKKFGKEFYMSPNKMPYKDAKAEAEKIAKKKGFSKIYLAASYQPEFADDNTQLDEGTPAYRKMMKKYKGSDMEKVFKILDKKGYHMGEQSDTLVRNMLEKFKGDVNKAADFIMKNYGFSKRRDRLNKENVEIDEERGTVINVMVKGDKNAYERLTRAVTQAKLPGYKGATFKGNRTTFTFDAKQHTGAVRKKFAKMIRDSGGEFDKSIEEGFSSDAQRRAAFASGYEAKGKKKKKEEELEERQDDYYDRIAAAQDARATKPKVEKTKFGFQVMVFSPKAKKFIAQGTPHKTKAAAEKDAKMFESVQIAEMSARAHYNKMKAQGKVGGGKIVTPIDRDRFPNREKEGLEGPYRSKKSGQVYYYDKKAGKYYDPLSDMFMQVKDVMEAFNRKTH